MTNQERNHFVDEWRSGNENMAAYCRTKKLQYQTFRLWVKRFEENPESPNPKPSLVKLEIPAIPGPVEIVSNSTEIHIGQFRVKIPTGSFNMENLEGIINILRKIAV